MGIYATIKNRITEAFKTIYPRIIFKNYQAGVFVDHDTALTHDAVWSAIRLLSETMGVLPIKIYDSLPNGGKREVTAGRISDIFAKNPNPEMNAQNFKETLTAHCAGWGNAYAEIEFDLSWRPVNLWPIPPDRVQPKRDENGQLYYEVRGDSGEIYRLEPWRVFHLKGFGFDGIKGYDPISYQASAIGQGLAAETYSASFFKNGAHLSGGLFHPKKLDKPARENLRAAFEESYVGRPDKAFKMAVFDEGVTWKEFSVSPEAAQLIQTRKYSVTAIARIFRVPPHMIGDLEKATFSNIESQGIEFVTYTALSWAVRWEAEINAKLLAGTAGRYSKITLNALMRGDSKTRNEAYQIGRQNGYLSANDIRELEDLNPIEGIAGSAYIVPLNFQLADDLDKVEEPAAAPTLPTDPAPKPSKMTKKQTPDNAAPLIASIADKAAGRLYNVISKHKKDGYWPEFMASESGKLRAWISAELETVTACFGLQFAPLDLSLISNYSENHPDRPGISADLTQLITGAITHD